MEPAPRFGAAPGGRQAYLELLSCVGNPDYGSAVGYQAPRNYTLSLEWAW